jgi:hypothetical protein
LKQLWRIELKKCFKCGITKPISEFYEHLAMADGYLNKCKECTKKDSAKRYNRLTEDPQFILSERERTRQRYYRLDYKNKYNMRGEQKRTVMQRYFENNPVRREATVQVGNAIKNGRLIKQPCEVCGAKEVQAHHEDYSKPLEVNWLCVKHHNERHIEIRKQKLLKENINALS